MLRTLFKTDLAQVLAIEKIVHIAPWTLTTFEACLQAGYLGWVLESNKKIIGFILIALTPEECHVLNIGVSHAHQHQGFGTQLLDYALDYARQKGAGLAFLEVRRSNSKAIALYRKMKFLVVGERKDYYPTVNGLEDALIFAKSLEITPSA